MAVKCASHARRDRDGMAIIGRTKRALMGIRFDDGEEDGAPNTAESGTVDVAPYEAAIAERDATIAGHESALADRDAEIQRLQAHNYTLMKQVQEAAPVESEETPNTGADIAIDDLLFQKNED